jgi:hypothetical protein
LDHCAIGSVRPITGQIAARNVDTAPRRGLRLFAKLCHVELQLRPTPLSADYAALVPLADTVNALTTTLPAIDASLFIDQLDAGNLLGAIGDPIAAECRVDPVRRLLRRGPISNAVEGTLLNLANPIP